MRGLLQIRIGGLGHAPAPPRLNAASYICLGGMSTNFRGPKPGVNRHKQAWHQDLRSAVDPADAAPWIEAMRAHKEREIVRPDLAKTGKRGAAVTKRWSRIAEQLRTVKAGERAHVSLGARNKARALAREHLARRVGDVFDE